MESEMVNGSLLEEYKECGIEILVDSQSSCSRKSPYFFCRNLKFVRSLVCNILSQYVASKESVAQPVKCIDVLGGCGISGLTWKKYLNENVEVKINNSFAQALEIVRQNAMRNNISVEVSNCDPAIILYEKGYNFIYLDCTNDAVNYFDAAFRNIARNGILVVTAKDDCSLRGNDPDIAMRRYNGRICRVLYCHELGIRLIIASMARAAAKYNKAISVLCCASYKNTITIAVKSRKGPLLANKSLENIRYLKHCMICENRKFYPAPNIFPTDPNDVKLDCNCESNAEHKTSIELGPVWSSSIFDISFIEGMLMQKSLLDPNLDLRTTLVLILEEARCQTEVVSDERESKRIKIDSDNTSEHPPFYFNIHKHHPVTNQLMKLNKICEKLKIRGYRASKTHFDRLAIRTNAPLPCFLEVMSSMVNGKNK